MKTLKAKSATTYVSQPVWCHHCCVRIAPYDMRAISRGKTYHRECYAKAVHAKSLTRER